MSERAESLDDLIAVKPRTSQEVVAIVREHATYVWRTLRVMGVREADLEDACQEVFIVVCRKLDGFEARSSIKTWLHGICLRVAAAYRRRAHVRNEVLAPPRDEPAPDCPERSVKERQELALLHRALEILDDDKRAVFVLYEVEQLSMKEVADAVGCPLQTAYSRYHAARERVAAFVSRIEKPSQRRVDAIARGVLVGIGFPGQSVAPPASTGLALTVTAIVGAAAIGAYVSTRDVEAPSLLQSAPPVSVTVAAKSEPAPAPTVSAAPTPVAPRIVPVPPPSETALLDAAQRALAANPGAALRNCNEHARHYPGGALSQEREVLAIDALVRLGRRGEAEARADRFRAAHPSSGHVRRIDVLLGKQDPDAR